MQRKLTAARLVFHTTFGVAFAVSLPVCAQALQAQAFNAAVSTERSPSALWRNRDVEALDLISGSGGKEHAPSGKFTFIEEDKQGSAPKFVVTDEQGIRWKVKLGPETQAETAATRLVWAAGYFTDEDYYLSEIRVDKLPRLKRGGEFVLTPGVVRSVRMEREVSGEKKTGKWSWSKNPFVGTRELNGLKVMMALINNWDLKSVNNDIYEERGEEARYAVTDLGATFGRTGNTFTRSKSDLKDYRKSKFLKRVKGGEADFVIKNRPFFLMVFNVPYYVSRTKMQGLPKHIPRADAKWLGQRLARLSPGQLRDCFRAGGFSAEEVEGFATVVQGRIAELNQL